MSRETIREARPVRHPEYVVRLQDETAEAVTLLNTKGDIGLAGIARSRGSRCVAPYSAACSTDPSYWCCAVSFSRCGSPDQP